MRHSRSLESGMRAESGRARPGRGRGAGAIAVPRLAALDARRNGAARWRAEYGRWGTATGVPGLAALNKGGAAEVDSVSCVRTGSCAAGGTYRNRRSDDRGFVTRAR